LSESILPAWPYAYGGPSGSGHIKIEPDDFFVEEQLSFEPEGNGEHVFLFIEKVGENTEYIARQLARHAGVRQRDIGYAGLKDRHGRTRQWFSVWLPGKEEPAWSSLASEQLRILQTTRHARKLKRGVLSGNRFCLKIRHWRGDQGVAEQQLQNIKTQGFPNYFGEQRFGHQGRNIEKALDMFQGTRVKPEQRSIYLSAARSLLFNAILAERIRQQTWNQLIPGDICKLDQSNSHFLAENTDPTLHARLADGDIHISGALWGKGDNPTKNDALLIEQSIAAQHPAIAEGLIKAGLIQDRRSLRVIPRELTWTFGDDDLSLSFSLPAGSYATALLRELISLNF